MKMIAPNLYQHRNGDWVCLLIEEAVFYEDAPAMTTGESMTRAISSVIYTTTANSMHTTPRGRWIEQFSQMPYYDGDNESVRDMIRRSNPGESGLGFEEAMESWHESEVSIAGTMLELAVAATAEKLSPSLRVLGAPLTLRIETADLQRIAENYEINRIPEPHAFIFEITKSG